MLRATALLCLALTLGCVAVAADTPANCTYQDYIGHWAVLVSDVVEPQTNCSAITPSISVPGVTLAYPNIATDDEGNVGNFTVIYNQGSEVWVAGKIWFAFSAYDSAGNSYCDRTEVGWVHNADGTEWRCFSAQRTSKLQEEEPKPAAHKKQALIMLEEDTFQGHRASAKAARGSQRYRTDRKLVEQINAAQSLWTAKEYPEFEQRTVADLQRMRGSPAAHPSHIMATLPPKPKHALQANRTAAPRKDLPISWDWRNVNMPEGQINFVSPVRDQGQCGSCYAFSSAGMMEARIRVASNNKLQPILSTQDVVSCSQYSQGCEGGFPYLVAGKYGRDFGLAEEACYPYAGVDEACNPNPQPTCNPERWFTNEYYYIGGYYGQSNPEVMMEEILANGPISVSFEVYDDFMHYSGGIYTHQFTKSLRDQYNPFELVNHAVLMVGWGVAEDAAETPYWIVKNSWGPNWGEAGYFRILRGSSEPGGECAIESITVSAIPILH